MKQRVHERLARLEAALPPAPDGGLTLALWLEYQDRPLSEWPISDEERIEMARRQAQAEETLAECERRYPDAVDLTPSTY